MNSLLTLLFLIVYFGYLQVPCTAQLFTPSVRTQEQPIDQQDLLEEQFFDLPQTQQMSPKQFSFNAGSGLFGDLQQQRVQASASPQQQQQQRQFNPLSGALAPSLPRRQVCFCCRAYVCQYQKCPCTQKFFL